jgi:prefoldin beta subunit
MTNSHENEIRQLQIYEQNIQGFLAQKQQYQQQLLEVNSAITELEKTLESYKIVGNIMIKSNSKNLINELTEKKEMLNLRIKSLEKQENQIKEKSKKIKDKVLQNMQGIGGESDETSN